MAEGEIMTYVQAIIMGIIQGLTEFLPVSSSGHLAIFKQILHINTETGLFFDILLHIGTLVAIFVAFYEDVATLFKEGIAMVYDICRNISVFFTNQKNKNSDKNHKEYYKILKTPYRRFVFLIIVATIPTGVIGIAGSDFVEWAQNGLLIPGICLIITALLLYLADHISDGKYTASDAKGIDAFKIGMAQGVATLPGLSRSGTTIAACLLCGFDRKFAVKFSFLMSIPAVLGAAVLEMKDIAESGIIISEIPCYITGAIVAAVVGYVSIKTMLHVVRKQKFFIFSIYCFIVGIVAIVGALAQLRGAIG